MLAGKGFEKVYNLSGGIKAWNSDVAYGGEDLALNLFSGDESMDRVLVVAYSLEEGLRDFYLSMLEKVVSEEVKKIFRLLADVEVKHQQRILDYFHQMTGREAERNTLLGSGAAGVLEGGLTTEEFVAIFKPDWNEVADVVGLAMSIEAQALDLYQRAARRNTDSEGRKFLTRIAEEEKTHLSMLGRLIDQE